MKLDCCDVYVKKNAIGYTVSINLFYNTSKLALYFQDIKSVADFVYNNDVLLYGDDATKKIIELFNKGR